MKSLFRIILAFLFLVFIPLPNTVVAQNQQNTEVRTRVGNPANIDTQSIITDGSFVYYCQGNTLWKNTCGIGVSGCGPTSLAMILSTFGANCNGQTCTPPVVDDLYRAAGYRSCGSGSLLAFSLQKGWLKQFGLTVGDGLLKGNTLNASLAKEFIDNGYLIIASSQKFPCANCKSKGALIDHIFVVDNVDPANGTVDIRDANNCSYADGNDENQLNRIKAISSFSWYYAYPIKKM